MTKRRDPTSGDSLSESIVDISECMACRRKKGKELLLFSDYFVVVVVLKEVQRTEDEPFLGCGRDFVRLSLKDPAHRLKTI